MKFLRHAYPSPGWILLCLYSLFGTLQAAEEPATGLVPIDVGMCFVAPDKTATLSWKAGNPGQQNEAPYIVLNYEGAEVGRGNATVSPDRTLTITRAFLRGYSEIRFPEAGQTFGIVSLEPHEGPADPFFCMDGALSWLEKDPARRTALVKIAARSGVAMSRERLGLGGVNPDKGTYHWEGTENHSFETLRKTYADNLLPILEILEGGGEHIGHVNAAGYARNHPELAATIADLARHWPVWGGAEVDNEPDLKPFSAEQYVPSVKSMSYGLSEARSKVPLVAGVFATIPPGPFFDTCVANGMLEDTDVVSFHSYDRAPSIEAMVALPRLAESSGQEEPAALAHGVRLVLGERPGAAATVAGCDQRYGNHGQGSGDHGLRSRPVFPLCLCLLR